MANDEHFQADDDSQHRPAARWAWNRGPTANLLAVVSLVMSVTSATLLGVWSNNSAAKSSVDQLNLEKTGISVQQKQSQSLDKILEQRIGAGGANPTPQAPKTSAMLADCSTTQTLTGGWGPQRPLYDADVTPNYALIDSVLNDPVVGDERAFYVIKDASDTSNGGWQTNITMRSGHTYVLRVFIRNDSADAKATAGGTKLSVSLPTCPGTSIASNAVLSSGTAFPNTVYSGISMRSDHVFNIAYVPGSAEVYNNSQNSPFTIRSVHFLESRGQQIGFNKLDGTLRAGYGWDVYFYFEIRPQFAP